MWREPEPKRHYEAVIIGGGGHGLATAFYLASHYGISTSPSWKGWIGSGILAETPPLFGPIIFLMGTSLSMSSH